MNKMSERCGDFGNYTTHDYGFVLDVSFMDCCECPNDLKVPCLYATIKNVEEDVRHWTNEFTSLHYRFFDCLDELHGTKKVNKDV